MASSPPDIDAAGFATPAALVLSLGLALVGAAVVGQSVMLLRLSKTDLERTRLEYALDGAQLEAASTVVRAGVAGPFHWSSATDLGPIDIRAEPESAKLAFETAAQLPVGAFASLGASDPASMKAKLLTAADMAVADAGQLDSTSLWRACAARLMSSYGTADAYIYAPDAVPGQADKPRWHVGETWRIRVTTSAGWQDDRIVRFTGSAFQPAATILRTISKGDGEGGRCESILQAIGAA